MKLYLNGTSPFARLARSAAIELGVELELVQVDPWADQKELLDVSPLSRVPVLVDDKGRAFSESLLILDQLIRRAEHAKDLRADDPEAIAELGIGFGMMELAFAYTIQKKHCGDAGAALQTRRQATLRRSLMHMEVTVTKDARWSLARLCLWVALDYIRFRNVVDIHQTSYPALFNFIKAHRKRQSLCETSFG